MRALLNLLGPSFAAGMNPLTLEFLNRETEERFQVDYIQRSLPIVRFTITIGSIQYLLFYVLDLMIEPLLVNGGITQLLIIRVAVFLILLAIVGWSFSDQFKRNFQFYVSLVPIIAGLGVIGMVQLVQNNGGYDQYHAGLMIIFFYIHVLLRLRFVYASVVGWVLFTMYILAYPSQQSQLLLINNAFFLISTQLCGMTASYVLEYYARTVFGHRRDLENRRRQIQQERDLKISELNSVREIQLSLLPAQPPHHPQYDIACSMQTATEIGGDFYDFSISKNSKLTFAIGDATGHGAKASALVTATKILFVSLAYRKELPCILEKASAIIRSTGLKKLYMSLAVGRLYKNQLELAGAGMPPAFIWRAATQTVEKIALNGMPLGAAKRYPYSLVKVPFNIGDKLFLMSDGLPELFNDDGSMYGYEQPEQLLRNFSHLPPSEIVSSIEKEIISFSGNQALRDDISIILIQKKESVRPVHH